MDTTFHQSDSSAAKTHDRSNVVCRMASDHEKPNACCFLSAANAQHIVAKPPWAPSGPAIYWFANTTCCNRMWRFHVFAWPRGFFKTLPQQKEGAPLSYSFRLALTCKSKVVSSPVPKNGLAITSVSFLRFQGLKYFKRLCGKLKRFGVWGCSRILFWTSMLVNSASLIHIWCCPALSCKTHGFGMLFKTAHGYFFNKAL